MSEDDKNFPRDEDDPFAEDEEDSSAKSEEDSPEPGAEEPDSESQDGSQSDSEEDFDGLDEENPYADSEYDSSEYGEEDSYGEIQDDASLNYGDDSYEYPEDDSSESSSDDSSVDSPEDSSSDSTETSLAKRDDDSPPDEDDLLTDSRMSFGEHLDELRSRLLKAIYGLLVGFIVCLIFGGEIFAFLAQPLLTAMAWAGLEPQLAVMSLQESFITYIKVCLYAGLFVSCPWVFYQLWVFIAAGLYPRERKYVHRIIPFSAILFLLGGAFFIFIVAPISCSFFIRFASHYPMPKVRESFVYKWLDKSFGSDKKDEKDAKEENGEKTDLIWMSEKYRSLVDLMLEKKDISKEEHTQLISDLPKLEEEDEEDKSFVKNWFQLQKYVSLIMVLGLAFGAAFQMPLVVFFLGRMQFVQLATFKANRKFVIFALVIVAALMTPPDVISQVALVVPMYLLYELGILLVWIWPAKRVE